jgi:hypothetical protein
MDEFIDELIGKKPEEIFVPEIGRVKDGQKVTVPKHNITIVEGSDTGIECPSTEGIAHFSGGVPNYMAVVECANANKLGVEVQCAKRWKSE